MRHHRPRVGPFKVRSTQRQPQQRNVSKGPTHSACLYLRRLTGYKLFGFNFPIMGVTVIGTFDTAPVIPTFATFHLAANTLTASFDVLSPSSAALWTAALVIGISTRSAMRYFLLSTRHKFQYTGSVRDWCTEFFCYFYKLFLSINNRYSINLTNLFQTFIPMFSPLHFFLT